MNNRHDERFCFQTRSVVKFKGLNSIECKSENLSMTGVLIDKIDGIKIGDNCKLNIIIDTLHSNLLIKMKATVIRFTDGKMALNFTEIDDDTLYHLKNVVNYNTAITES